MRLENVTRKEAHLASDKWIKVKQEMLGGVIGSSRQNPGCMITDCIYFFADNPELLDSWPITVQKIVVSNTKWDYAFYVIKGKWFRDQLDDVVTQYHFGAPLLWILPNMERTLSKNEAREFWAIVSMSVVGEEPEILHLENVNRRDEVLPSLYEREKVKKELLAEVFGEQNPGFMVTNCNFFIDDMGLLSSGPITIYKFVRYNDLKRRRQVFFVVKENWSRD